MTRYNVVIEMHVAVEADTEDDAELLVLTRLSEDEVLRGAHCWTLVEGKPTIKLEQWDAQYGEGIVYD